MKRCPAGNVILATGPAAVAAKDIPATLKTDKDKAFFDRFPLGACLVCRIIAPFPNSYGSASPINYRLRVLALSKLGRMRSSTYIHSLREKELSTHWVATVEIHPIHFCSWSYTFLQ